MLQPNLQDQRSLPKTEARSPFRFISAIAGDRETGVLSGITAIAQPSLQEPRFLGKRDRIE